MLNQKFLIGKSKISKIKFKDCTFQFDFDSLVKSWTDSSLWMFQCLNKGSFWKQHSKANNKAQHKFFRNGLH